jgi:KamA family protein
MFSQTTRNTPREKRREFARVKYVRTLDDLDQLTADDRESLRAVTRKYAFRANDYYLRLVDWDDPNDPIRQLIVPRVEELNDWGALDASNEQLVTVAPGVQHKYTDTVLLLCSEVCGAFCRYCFRKRLFMGNSGAVDIDSGIQYIADHPEVTNVLLTGGDPLILSTKRLVNVIHALREIPHVQIIRLGSKMPAFNPFRISEDDELLAAFSRYSTAEKRIHLMAHFDHPRELTPQAIACIDACIRRGVVCVNQCPLIRGINDDPEVLHTLYSKLSYIGCTPYYLFQGRPTAGNQPYTVPIVRGWSVFQEAICRGSGLARRARFCMSHESGKVEVLAVDQRHIYLRYHQAKNQRDLGRFFICHRDEEAYWLDQLEEVN